MRWWNVFIDQARFQILDKWYNCFKVSLQHPSLNEPLQNNQGDKLILESCNGLLKFSLLDVSPDSVWAGSLVEMRCSARGFKEKIAPASWIPEHQSLGRPEIMNSDLDKLYSNEHC